VATKKERLPRWTTAGLLDETDPNAISKALGLLEKIVKEMESYKSQLTNSISVKNFLKLVRLYDQFRIQAAKLAQYASMKYDENMFSQKTFEFYKKIDECISKFINRLIFFRLWWKNLDEENMHRLLSKLDKDHRHEFRCMYFEDLLEEAEEKIVNLKDLTGIYALAQMYDILTSSLIFNLKIGGKNKTLSVEEMQKYRFSGNPSLRKAEYTEELRKYAEIGHPLAFIYQAVIADHVTEDLQIRSLKKPRLYGDSYNNISDTFVESMFLSIRKNVGVFQRYFVLKAKALGKKKLRRYDVCAPLPKTKPICDFTFREASEFILDTFYSFSQEFGDVAKNIFDGKRIDARILPEKISGAYCATVTPETPAWITIQYQGGIKDVVDFAHELGHGINLELSKKHSIGTFDSNQFIGELASTFSEMLVLDRLLGEAKDAVTKRYVLGFLLDNIYLTLVTQGYRAIWENETTKLAEEGILTSEAMDQLYLDLSREQFGDAIYVPDEFRKEWLTIAHFFRQPNYVYSYMVNEAIKIVLFDKYKKNKQVLKPKIIKLFSSGSSAYPMQLTARASVNIRSERFMSGVFKIISKMVDKYEALLNER
jgi:oligoendopeptidase F